MNILAKKINDAATIAISGHIRPDGDCTGACLALYNYIKQNCEDKKVCIYLEKPSGKFAYLSGYEEIITKPPMQAPDLAIFLDAASDDRLGENRVLLEMAKDSLCIDHHVTNTKYAKATVLEEDASSTCEVLSGFLDFEKIDKAIAECLYTGIVHDTGVFKYSCTSPKTMEIAARLMAKGIDFTDIIDKSYYAKNNVQNQITGRALMESILLLDERCIFSYISKKTMDFYGAKPLDMDGVIDLLRNTDGVEVAVFMYEIDTHKYKVSMRSNKIVNVSKIASLFGGGGHIRAAGCTMDGMPRDIISNLAKYIEKELPDV